MLAVLYSSECTDSSREEGSCGSWSTEYDFTIDGVEHLIGSDDEPMSHRYSHETFGIPGKPGEMAYVLYMTFSSGDSFGKSTGNGDILMVYTDKAMAKEAMDIFKKATSDYKDPSTVSIPVQHREGRTMFKCPNASWGYFEQVENIEIHSCMIV